MAAYPEPETNHTLLDAANGSFDQQRFPLSSYKLEDELPDTNQEAWKQRTLPLLTCLLKSVGYNEKRQQEVLEFYQKLLLPAIGPFPQRFRSAITRSGLPVEFSVNYQQRGDTKPVVRIGFEALDTKSGSPQDPYNCLAIREFLSERAITIPGFDKQLLEYFWDMHTLSAAEQTELNGAKTRGSDLTSQAAFGFDFKPEGVSVKGYTFPALKCTATCQKFEDLITKSMAQVPCATDTSAAFAIVDEYMRETDGYSQFAFFSWDCVKADQSRLKLYGVRDDVSWLQIKEIWTLGGRVQSPTVWRGLEYLETLWQLLGIHEGKRNFTGGFDDGVDYTPTPIVWNYEMKPGVTTPLSKLYFPVHGENDRRIVQALVSFFDHIGLHDEARDYEQNVEDYFFGRDLNHTSRLTSWVSFAYTEKTGVYLSVYYHSSSDYPWLEEENKAQIA